MSGLREFSEFRIEDVALEFHDGPHATPPPSDTGPIYLGIKNLTEDGFLDLSSIRHIAEEDFDRWTKRVIPQADDLIFTYEATLHRYALIPPGFDGCLGRRLALLRPDPNVVDPKYLLFVMLGPEWRQTVQERVIAGATVERIPLINFLSFPLWLPPLPVQRQIAALLSAFDDLIDVNERRIDLVENLARSLYRSWFIHFRYPRSEQSEKYDTSRGVVPEGWKIGRVADIAQLVTEGVNPSEFVPGQTYIGLEHLPRRSTTLRQWGVIDSVKSRKVRFREGDTLFGKIRPNLHKVSWAPFEGLASTDAMVFRPKEGNRVGSFLNSILASDQFIAEAIATSNGTKMPRANSEVLLSHAIAIPDDELLAEFEGAVSNWLKWSAELVSQNRLLRRIRGRLLSRLVTGQLDIAEIDLGPLRPIESE